MEYDRSHTKYALRGEGPPPPRVSEDDQRNSRGYQRRTAQGLAWKPTKDAASCAKAPGRRKRPSIRGCPKRGTRRGSCPAARTRTHTVRGTTRGTETSKYPEEEKSTEIAGVAASETARAQTHARVSVRALPHGGRGSPFPGTALPGRGYKGWEAAERHGRAGRSG